MERVYLDEAVELLHDELGLLGEVHGIAGGPPVAQVPGRVVVPPLVIKAVRELVPRPAASQ